MQVVKHLRLPRDVRVEHVAREFQRETDCVPVVVVCDVFAPVDQPGPVLIWVREVPVVNVHHAITAIDFDHRRDQRQNIVADILDVWTVIDDEPVSELHQRRRRTGLGRVNRARDVIDWKRSGNEAIRFGFVHVDCAGIGELREPRAVLFES